MSGTTWTKLVINLFILLALLSKESGAKSNSRNAVVDDIADFKDFKKLLRTKTNVLVLFVTGVKESPVELKVFREAANAIRGTGTMVLIDCTQTERKKLCKKLKVSPSPYLFKHYKDGDFHKDYDRQVSVASMINFMRDPAGDLPWEEDPVGADVLHFSDYQSFQRHLRKDMRPMLVMFYVPWCGFCKRLKPDYSKAATEVKGKNYVIAAMDVERTENAPARRAYNITGFPTILYFERGQLKRSYEGDNNKDGIIAFMKDPDAAPVEKEKEADWSADPNSEIVHLTTQGFEPVLKDEKSVLVMFYAPWCGHCKRMKPEYEKAALIMKERKIPGILAALDATKEKAIAEQFEVRGYPTLKFFINGIFKFDVNVRDAPKIVEFMRDPKEPPPPPPPEKSWEEENTEVLFLNDENFSTILKRKKHALVMFYAPWCGHCKKAKPEFSAAAEELKDDLRIVFAAVDCTKYQNLCQSHGANGYPTITYFSYLKTKADYNGGRSRKDFVAYMSNPNLSASEPVHIKHKADEL
ncbi:protein disulfide-isomerase A5 [Anastrepha ludens]|uniref:protein disulfide-isomerase A5 n=1 Tax=Anastrepha ludens TaxID=28586 RepID=UPI0023B04581|nr:protein disulfide-isomerase A5 [Anastrepha ludens]